MGGHSPELELRISLSGESVSRPLAERFSAAGLIRGEFILRAHARPITHPPTRELVQRYVRSIAEAFAPRSVWYRAADLLADEAAGLQGGPALVEANPLLGLRGLRRALAFPEVFATELGAVAEVASDHANLHILLPFVSDADEFDRALGLLERAEWPNRLGTMLEVPAALSEAARFVELGATNLLIGLNDLSCLFLGRDRSEGDAPKLHLAVWDAIERVAALVPRGVEWGIAGTLSSAILDRARAAHVPYASIHYSEIEQILPGAWDLPQREHVAHVKRATRERALLVGRSPRAGPLS